MVPIQYPESNFNIKKEKGKDFIFDSLRKKWLLLTPEEWVRQNFLHYLIQVKKYPASLIALEKMITLGELNKRFDILVYDSQHQPWLMIECKASQVSLTKDVLHQLLRYHVSIPVGYLVITNGANTLAWKKVNGELVVVEELPEWGEGSEQ